jgi:hypothetical protein
MSLVYLVSGEELKVMTVSWPTFGCELRLPQASVLNVDQMSWPVFCVSGRKSAAGWEQCQGLCPTTVPLTSVLAQRNCESLVGGSWHWTWHLNFWCSNVSSTHTASFLLYFTSHVFLKMCILVCVCVCVCVLVCLRKYAAHRRESCEGMYMCWSSLTITHRNWLHINITWLLCVTLFVICFYEILICICSFICLLKSCAA